MFHTSPRIGSERIILGVIILAVMTASSAWGQSSANLSQRSPESRSQAEEISDSPKPVRKIHRIGTALETPPGSISLKSTDAGPASRRPSRTTCSNCGIIDSINKINLNAIAGGVVAGTIAREVIRQAPHQTSPYPYQSPYPIGSGYPPHPMDGINGQHGPMHHPNQYQVGVTMSDGSQSIIVLPDVSHLQHGDRVQLIDGAIVVDR